jgi:hypothetical protein
MAHPKAYNPQQGYKYQILCRISCGREWEHCDYSTLKKGDLNKLLGEYKLAYGSGWEFKVILLPSRYHPGPDLERKARHYSYVHADTCGKLKERFEEVAKLYATLKTNRFNPKFIENFIKAHFGNFSSKTEEACFWEWVQEPKNIHFLKILQ